MKPLGFFLGLVSLFLLCQAELENTSVQRNVELNSQVYREVVQLAITNNGADAVSKYDFVLEHPEHLAFFEPKAKKSGVLRYTFADKGEHRVAVIHFETPLASNEKVVITVSIVKTHVFQPYPREVAQGDKQQMLYVGNLLYSSVYPTQKTKTIFSAPNEEVTTPHTELSISGNKLTYGPSNNRVEPNSYEEVRIHYTNNGRFLVTESLVRTLEVSHWGNNLAYEEFYDVIHGGAKLKGQYSRLEYDRDAYKHHETPVIKGFSFEIPPDASDVYYRDIIGNISTSNFRSSPFEQSSLLELRPRFPLYGGWKTSWYHGYNTLLSNSLQVADGETYILTFDFVAPYEDAVIDDFTLRVTLPEGATDIKFISDTDLGIEESREIIQTYLDTVGRPVVVIKKKNVVNEHQVPVQITYKYPKTLMLQEPLLLIAFYFVLFVISMIVVRVDLRILTPEVEKRDQISKIWYDLVEQLDLKKNVLQKLRYADKVDKKKKEELDKELEPLDEKIKEIQDELKKIDGEISNKVETLQTEFKSRFTMLTQEGAKAQRNFEPTISELESKIDETLREHL